MLTHIPLSLVFIYIINVLPYFYIFIAKVCIVEKIHFSCVHSSIYTSLSNYLKAIILSFAYKLVHTWGGAIWYEMLMVILNFPIISHKKSYPMAVMSGQKPHPKPYFFGQSRHPCWYGDTFLNSGGKLWSKSPSQGSESQLKSPPLGQKWQ